MEPTPELPPLTDLITSLEQATHLAKQLPAAADQTHFLKLISSLHSTSLQLTSLLNHLPIPPQAPENSVSSAVGGEEDPMQIGDGGDTQEEDSMIVIDRVEERLRNCVIQNKRRKRRLSPASMGVEQRRVYGDSGGDNATAAAAAAGSVEVGDLFDPRRSRSRGFDLVFQFHG